MLCPKCRQSVLYGAKFCNNCGASLDDSSFNIKELLEKSAQLLNQNKLTEAEKILNKLLEEYPTNHIVLNNIGVLHLKRKNRKKAREFFLKSLSVNPDFELAKKNLKAVYPWRKIVYPIIASFIIVGLVSGVINLLQNFSRDEAVQEFLTFVPASQYNTANADMEYIIDNYTDNLESYRNKIPGIITSTPIDKNLGIYQIDWKITDVKTNRTYDFKFKYLEKAQTIRPMNYDSFWLLGNL